MKTFLLALAVFALIVMFADGGLEVSPTVSPSLDFKPALEFSPNVSYAPDRSVTTTNIETNIEHQTVIVQQPAQPILNRIATLQQGNGGVTLVDPAGTTCAPLPGETIVNGPDIKGACTVEDSAGNRFFLNAVGSRWPLERVAPAPLQPQHDLTLEQLQAAFLRNGGELPMLWNLHRESGKIAWLKQQVQTWQ